VLTLVFKALFKHIATDLVLPGPSSPVFVYLRHCLLCILYTLEIPTHKIIRLYYSSGFPEPPSEWRSGVESCSPLVWDLWHRQEVKDTSLLAQSLQEHSWCTEVEE